MKPCQVLSAVQITAEVGCRGITLQSVKHAARRALTGNLYRGLFVLFDFSFSTYSSSPPPQLHPGQVSISLSLIFLSFINQRIIITAPQLTHTLPFQDVTRFSSSPDCSSCLSSTCGTADVRNSSLLRVKVCPGYSPLNKHADQ